MLLRESGQHDGSDIDLSAIHGEALRDCGIDHAALLVDYAESFVAGSEPVLQSVRLRLLKSMGEAALVDAAATVAIFTAVVRIADATGIPLEPYKETVSEDLRSELELDAWRESKR